MLIRYYLKQQSKFIIGIAAIFMLVALVLNIQGVTQEWYTFLTILCLLPLFFTSNIFSTEIENGTHFLIFTSRTPKYKILIKKYFYNWIISESLISIIYMIAFFNGLEKSLFGLLALIIYSTVLSLTGLLISNITSNTLLGYGIPLGIWAIQMILGFTWHESHPLLSIIINLMEKSVQVWSNIIFMIILIIILVIFNLFIVSRGENFRNKLVCKGVLIVIISSLICLFLYNSFFIKLEFWKNNEWAELKGNNINFHYKNLDDKRAKELLNICDTEANILKDILGEKMIYNEVYTWYGLNENQNSFIENKEDVCSMPFYVLRFFNPPEYFLKMDWRQYSNSVLMEPMLKNIESNNENDILKECIKDHIYYLYIAPKIKNKFKRNKFIIVSDYCLSKEDYIKNFIEYDLGENEHSLSAMTRKLLYELDKSNHKNTIKLFNYINNSEKKLSYSDIERFINNNYNDKSVKEVLDSYNKAREYHKKY